MTKWLNLKNSPYNVSDVLDDKGSKLYKRGFRLLEEQLATYIKEHYSGVSKKLSFRQFLFKVGMGRACFVQNIVPVIYDLQGNKAYLGKKVVKSYSHYGSFWDVEAILMAGMKKS